MRWSVVNRTARPNGGRARESRRWLAVHHPSGTKILASSVPPTTRQKKKRKPRSACGSECHLVGQETGSVTCFRLRQLPNELHGFITPPPACLDGHHHEKATCGRHQFWVRGFFVDPCSDQHSSVNISSVWSWFA